MNRCPQCPNITPAMRAQGHDCGFPDCVGWHIEKNVKPIPDRRHDYDFWHEDCDDENRLCGTAESVTDAMQKISRWPE